MSDPIVVDVTAELRIQRVNTQYFISADPVAITLIPQAEVRLPSGGTRLQDQAPRAVQTFRLIPMSHTERPQRSTQGTTTGAGQQRRNDFTLLGAWDAVVAANDWWEDPVGEKWVVDSIVPFNGYEVRAMITAFGRTG